MRQGVENSPYLFDIMIEDNAEPSLPLIDDTHLILAEKCYELRLRSEQSFYISTLRYLRNREKNTESLLLLNKTCLPSHLLLLAKCAQMEPKSGRDLNFVKEIRSYNALL